MDFKTKYLLVCGAILAIVGSFLPWQREGDFVSNLTYGLRITKSTFEDNGGLLIILLAICVLILIFKPHQLISKPVAVSITFGFALVIVSAYRLAVVVIHNAQANGVIGAPMIEIGLIMVSLGSILIFLVLGFHYKKVNQSQAENSSRGT